MAGFYFYRTPSWVDGILVGLSLAVLVAPLYYAIILFGEMAAMAEGNPTGVSLAPIADLLRTSLVGVLVGVEVLLPVSMYMDARDVARSGVAWQPNPGTYALGGFLFPLSVVVGVYYLVRRSISAFDE